MIRDLSIVSQKNKPFYTLKLHDGTELHIKQPTVDMYFRIMEVKKMEMTPDTMAEAFHAGMDLVIEYLNMNVEKKKIKKDEFMKTFTVPEIQGILGDIWNYSMGIDNEKNS